MHGHTPGASLAAALIALGCALAGPVMAGDQAYLARNELLCDVSAETCVRGSLTYEKNSRLLELRGRVESAAGPGMLQIMLKGTTRLGYPRYAPMEVKLRGRYSEIVDFRMIPDYPDVADWQIDRITFTTATEDD